MNVQWAKEYRDRWQAVATVELEEQQMSSVEQRWQQLNAIWRLALGLGLITTEPDEETDRVRQRWAQLKRG